MTEENNENQEQPDELEILKQRAVTLGISHHPNIGLDKLRAKINEKLNPTEDQPETSGEQVSLGNFTAAQLREQLATLEAAERVGAAETFTPMQPTTPAQHLAARKKKALRLVRIRVTNMNPVKGNLLGEILSCGNAEIGFVKKFIPFNAEQGWHVPQIMVDVLKSKKYMSHYEVKIGNKKVKKHRLVSEYAIEIMPPLTAEELQELKQRQIIASKG